MNKFIRLFIGVNIYALTINLLQGLNLGMGSFDSLTQEIQNVFGLSEFGNASFMLHFIFFILLLCLANKYRIKKKMIFLSIFSILILTRVVNLYSLFNFNLEKTVVSAISVILTLNIGLYLIASTNLIIAPFDKFVVETSNYFKISLGKSRVVCDVTLLIIVILINSILTNKIEITLFTFVITFGTGLNIGMYEYIDKKISSKP